jgi:uncharacterized protein YlxW (UPF0749 family)
MTATEKRYTEDFLTELFQNPLDPGYADAAARRAERGPAPVWRTRALLALRIVTLVATGFLFTVAYREALAPESSSAHAGLVDQVKTAQARVDDLASQDERLRRQVTAEQQAALGASAQQLNAVRQAEASTGLAAVTGPGAVVRLSDAPAQIDPTTGKTSGAPVSRVLDVDLQSVVNALWASGAEAVAVNGQRLATTSTIRSAGDAILVDFHPITSPYDISAVGPSDLAERFNQTKAAASMRALVEQYGLGLSTRQEDRVTLPAAASPALRYAHPAPSVGGK